MLIPIIYPYKLGSNAAKLLAQSLETKRVRINGNYKYRHNHLIINLGNSQYPIWDKPNIKWINQPENVSIACCKLKTFLKLKEANVAIPEFSEDIEDAKKWIKDGSKVACRAILNGHSGAGLTIVSKIEELDLDAKLYVKYFPKKEEYRTHLIRDNEGLKIFDFVQKKKKKGIPNEEMNYQVRNVGQWIFAREGVVLPECVKSESIKAVEAIGLDLASVDICYNVKEGKCVVLEVNSASGLCPETCENYTNAILSICDGELVKEKQIEIKLLEPVKDKEWEKKEILKLIPNKKSFEYPPNDKGLELKNNAYVSLDEYGRISIHMELDSWLGAKLENFEFDAAPFAGG